MSWLEFHTQSEKLAMEAGASLRRGERDFALSLYREAATLEEMALDQIDTSKARTRGITAVSAFALWYKASEYGRARRLAVRMLADQGIPDFAREQLKDLVQAIEGKSPARDGYEQAPVELYKTDKRQRAAELHTNAAKHHADAAYHHKEAAKHYADGNYEKAGYHAHIAYVYELLAAEHEEEAAIVEIGSLVRS